MLDLNGIAEYVQQTLQNDTTGHDFAHIKRVVSNARQLLVTEPHANRLIVLTAAYLHDVIDDKLVDDVQVQQNEVQRQLKTWGYESDDITAIMEIMTHMSYSANLKHHYQLSLEGQIVQDADRLDALGAIGIARAIYFGGHFGDPIYDPQQEPRNVHDKTTYRHHTTIINHFYEKLFHLPGLMNTLAAKKIATQRCAYMHTFVTKLKAEWQGKN
jgi:uncharacterized protein